MAGLTWDMGQPELWTLGALLMVFESLTVSIPLQGTGPSPENTQFTPIIPPLQTWRVG